MAERPSEFDREWLIPTSRDKALLDAGAKRISMPGGLAHAQRTAQMLGLVPFGFGASYDIEIDRSSLFLWCRPREPQDG